MLRQMVKNNIGRRRALHWSSFRSQAVPDSTDLQTRVQSKIAEIDSLRPFSSALVDSFNRRHDYLRISLTEKCNLRCFYCMPSDGVELSPKENILSDDEIIRLATLFVMSGVTKIRLTGGEPTVRKGIVELVSRLNRLRSLGLKSIAMTSNGLALHRKLPLLIEKGLTHLNLSLDTLDPFKFELMTRRMGHDAVLRSLDVALASPSLKSVKLNVVVIRGLNDSEVPQFVEMTRNNNISIRFIEFMPFTGNKWDKAKMVPSSELLNQISSIHASVYKISDELNDTARSYAINGYRGTFGFISSMSDHFCGTCNRLRITADGQIKVCLFDSKEVSLRDQIRAGASDVDLLQVIRKAVGGKKEKHASMEDIDVVTNRPMIRIGGSKPSLFAWPLRRGFLTPVRFAFNTGSVGNPLPFQPRCMSSASETHHRPRLTHIDDFGRPTMVSVSSKEPTKRIATASGRIYIPAVAYELVTNTRLPNSAYGATSDAAYEMLERQKEKSRSKGDILTVSQLAGIMGSKRTSDLIPLCHPLSLSHVSVTLTPQTEPFDPQSSATRPRHKCPPSAISGDVNVEPRYTILCQAAVSCEGKTGVEMEALTAVSVSLLTVWDMLKAVAGKDMVIADIYVTSKSGGKSGDFSREQ